MNSKQIKVCFVTTISLTMDWFVIPFAKEFKARGIDVTLLCSFSSQDFKERNSSVANCVNIPMSRGISFLGGLKSIRLLKRFFKNNEFDEVSFMKKH